MVQVSAFRRDMARESERIAATVVAGRATGPTMEHLTRLTQALTRQTEIFSAFTSVDESDVLQATPARAEVQPVQAPATRSEREDQILADVLAHPEQVRDVARIVPPETFTTVQRREIYETVVTLVEAQDPVDEIIVLWELERQRALVRTHTPLSEYRETPAETDAAYLARLAATTVVVGAAITMGHQLVVDDVRAQLTASALDAHVRQVLGVDGPTATPAGPAIQLDTTLTQPSLPQPGPQPRLEM
jgi:hypothetical protein